MKMLSALTNVALQSLRYRFGGVLLTVLAVALSVFVLLGVEHVDAQTASETVNILLKYRSDIEKAVKEFSSDESLNSSEGN